VENGQVWPLGVYFLAVLVVVAGIIVVSYLLGQRHRDHATGVPFESGIAPTGTARIRFDVQFYLNAVFFVVFDLEAAFIFAWAVSVRELGWSGYVEMLVFVAILLASLVYLWRLGALDWRPTRVRRPRS